MYLKEVTFNGFKSFADKTRIQLEPGITCIVGPNGCGKSNIVDAIRWVLGEKSAKALRGGNMQDVIFAGTDKRKPLSMCEVALLFGDCESALGNGFNEVEIKRRVSVDGKSDYYINSKACRLKDIQNLFMDTGIGQQSYSFMAQGQIDQILSANPSERRSIFEEAAGITRYKTQRKEALSKLELVEQNLSRVSDVIEEVSRQIGSLKRQAGKALRYQRLKHRLTHLDLAYHGFRHARLEESIAQLETEEAKLRNRFDGKKSELRGTEELISGLRARLSELNANIQNRQQGIFDLRSEKENAEVQSKYLLETRCNDLQNRIAEIETEIAEILSYRDALDKKAADNTSFKQEQLNLVGSSDEIVKKRNEELNSQQSELKTTEQSWNEARQELLMYEGSITRLRSNCTSIEVELSKYQERHATLSEQLYKLNNERQSKEQELAEIRKTLEIRQSENAREQETLALDKKALTDLLTQFRQLQSDLQNQDRELTRRTAQLKLLEDLQEKMEGFSEGAKAILKGKLQDTLPPDACRLLSQDLIIPSTYTSAMEALLSGAADTLVIQDNISASAVFRELSRNEYGKASLQIPSVPGAQTGHVTALPEFIAAVKTKVSTSNESLKDALSRFTAHCYFCDTLDHFLDFWKENPAFEFLFVATQNGELLDRRGLVYGGKGKGGSNASFLQRQNDIRTLKQEITEKQKILDALHEQREKLQNELTGTENKIEERRQLTVEIGQEISTLQAEEKGVQQQLEQNNREREKSEKDLSDFEYSGESSRQKLQEAQGTLAEAERNIEEKKARISEFELKITTLRLDLDQRRESLSAVRFDLQEKKQRLEIIERGLSEIQQQKAETINRVARLSQELDRVRAQIAESQQQAAAYQSKASELALQLEMLQTLLLQEKKEYDEITAQVAEKEQSISGERDQVQELTGVLSKVEISLAGERNQRSFIQEKFQTDYQIDIATVAWKKELWEADTEFVTRVNLDELEDGEPEAKAKHRGDPTDEDFAAMDHTDWVPIAEEIKVLREKVLSMSDSVNLNAIAEYVELRERYNFLKTQSDDLWKSKEELLKAIDEINKTSLQLFQNTFEQIRKNFHFTFEKLFGGGFADLQLLTTEDPLDSGIEIIARPPGTKLRSLTLLSGGQKTMTAVALLFAIYMVKPSPFCVLDELDAPLDEANIGRFTDMVRQFTQYSQFLVVSHSKRTIATADNIYGATMQERGVTRLISMRFNRETGQAEEAKIG